MSALDTLASEAVHTLSNGDGKENGHAEVPVSEVRKEKPPPQGDGEGQAEEEQEEPVAGLEAEEAGGPPMPAAGQEAAATKPAFADEVAEARENHLTSAGQAAALDGGIGGHGDAAMAAVDERVDTNELPHTNGDLLADAPSEDRESGQAELDYARVANLTGAEPTNGERVPQMSMDVDHPARGDGEKEGEPALPAPGAVDGPAPVPLGEADLSEPAAAVPAEPHPLTAASGEELLQPSAETQQTIPEPADSHSLPSEQATAAPSAPLAPEPSAPSSSSAVSHPVPETSASLAGEPDASAASAPPPASDAPPASMDALPSDPAPLPSQLVSSSVPASDASQSLAAPPPSEQPAAPEPSPAAEPTIPDHAAHIPQTHPDQIAPPEASPSLAKRPFEPDGSEQSRPYEGDSTEPAVKKQRFSNEPEEQLAHAGEDADADAEADVDASMLDTSLDVSKVEDSMMLDQPATPAAPQASTSAAAASGSADVKPSSPPMPKEQQKYALAILRQLKRKTEAGPFLQPVDPDAQGIPHYRQVITSPMDLSTVESKLQGSKYTSAEQFAADMRRIWENCYTFNGPESGISAWAKTLSGIFEKQLPKMPSLQSIEAKQKEKEAAAAAAAAAKKRSESPADKKLAQQKKQRRASQIGMQKMSLDLGSSVGPGGVKKEKPAPLYEGQSPQQPFNPSASAGPSSAPHAQAQAGAAAPGDKKPKKSKKAQQGQQHPGQQPGQPPLQQLQMGGQQGFPGQHGHQITPQQLQLQMQLQQQQAQQMGLMGMPTPLSAPLPTGPSPQHRANDPQLLVQEQLKFCKEVVKELFKKQHSAFAYPFYDPVDYVALGIPDYPKVIRRPMDLGTMKRKLDQNQYRDAAAFESDFKLLVNNCFTYNPPKTPVHEMGRQLQTVFYDKYQDLPQTVPQQEQWGYGDQGYGYGGESDDGFDNEQINLMQRQLELLTGNLEMMKAKARMKMQHRQQQQQQYGSPTYMNPMQQQSPMAGAMQVNPMHTQLQMQPPPQPAPKPARPPPTQRAAPKPQQPKRKSSGSFSTPSSSTPAAPKPRTTKRSSMAGRERDAAYVPPVRGRASGNGDSDYEDEEPEATVTFDMKRELAEKIQEFDGPKLDKVVDIIRNSAPELLGDDSKEIELDIDMLDQRTLLKLYEYVVHPVGRGRQLKPKKNKPKGRNRGVDEVAEEERINALQAQLDAMEHSVQGAGTPVAGAPALGMDLQQPPAQAGRGDVASSSSEDEDDGEGSESESDGFQAE